MASRVAWRSSPKRGAVWPDDVKARHPSIAWKEMAGAGSVYRHDHEEVDADEVWVTVQDHLPPLRTVVEHELGLLGAT